MRFFATVLFAAFMTTASGTACLAAAEYTGDRFMDPFGADTESGAIGPRDEIQSLGLTLEGLIWNSPKPQAIVAGKIVSIGSTVNGAEVLSIDPKGVRMRYKDQVFTLAPKGKKT